MPLSTITPELLTQIERDLRRYQNAAVSQPLSPSEEDMTIAEIIKEFLNRGAALAVGETRKAARADLCITKTKYKTVLMESRQSGGNWEYIAVIGTEPHPKHESNQSYCWINQYAGYPDHVNELVRIKRNWAPPGQHAEDYRPVSHYWVSAQALGPYTIISRLFMAVHSGMIEYPNAHIPLSGESPTATTQPATVEELTL